MSTFLGQDSQGDFDMLSLTGVDFGENYDEPFKGEVTDWQSKDYNKEFGMEYSQGYYNQMGVTPQYVDPKMGIIPSGMGEIPRGMGSVLETEFLGVPAWMWGVGAIAAFYFLPKVMK